MHFVALDTETTGFDPQADRIVEFFAVRTTDPRSFHWDESWHWVLDPGVPIPPAATAVHGFTDADVAGKPRFADIAAEVQNLLAEAVIVAYNGAKFDLPLLDAELKRAGQAGLQPDHPIIDPLIYFREELPHTLSGAAQFYLYGRDFVENPHPMAHTAEGDVRMLLNVVREQAQTGRPFGRYRFPEDWVRPWHDSKPLFENVGGDVVFAFGKHRGKPASEHPGYLRWMLGQAFPDDVKGVAQAVLAEVGA